MLSIETAAVFFTICFSLCWIPSPEMVVVFSSSSKQGYKAGLAITLGVSTGLLAQTIAMAFGVTAVVQTSMAVFVGLKVIGTCYLFFLAWQAFIQPISVPGDGDIPQTLATLYRKGLTMNLSNPMNPLFLLVFLPPFVEYERGAIFAQLFQLGTLLTLAAMMVLTIITVISAIMGHRFLRSTKVQHTLRLGSGTTITVFAIYLALAKPLIP